MNKSLAPSIEEIEECLEKNLSVDNICVQYLLGLYRRSQAIVDKPWVTLIRAERKRQDEKWGEQNHQDQKWLTILLEEFGELAEAILNEPERGVEELVQIAAVSVAWLEAIERRPREAAEAAKKEGE